MPKDNEVDEKAVLWRAPHGSGKWMHFEHEPKHLKSYEPLYSAATVAELRAEVAEQSAWADKWKALHDAVSLAHEVQAKSLTRALDRADAAERLVGELIEAIREYRLFASCANRDAIARLDALTGADPT